MSSPYGRPKGMLTLEPLGARVGEEQIETVIVGFTDHYGRLVGKRYDAEMFVEETASHGTHGCDYLLTTDMEMEPSRLPLRQLGAGLRRLSLSCPISSTLRIASWLDKTASCCAT